MEPAKQAKIMQEFQKQSAQMDMTVSYYHDYRDCQLVSLWTSQMCLVSVFIRSL
jgi:hypothetical protein